MFSTIHPLRPGTAFTGRENPVLARLFTCSPARWASKGSFLVRVSRNGGIKPPTASVGKRNSTSGGEGRIRTCITAPFYIVGVSSDRTAGITQPTAHLSHPPEESNLCGPCTSVLCYLAKINSGASTRSRVFPRRRLLWHSSENGPASGARTRIFSILWVARSGWASCPRNCTVSTPRLSASADCRGKSRRLPIREAYWLLRSKTQPGGTSAIGCLRPPGVPLKGLLSAFAGTTEPIRRRGVLQVSRGAKRSCLFNGR